MSAQALCAGRCVQCGLQLMQPVLRGRLHTVARLPLGPIAALRPLQRTRTPKLLSKPGARLQRLRVQAATSGEVEVDVEEDTMERMEKSLESVKRSFSSVRTGRANPAMLDRIEVDYYGTPTPLKTIAGVTVPDSSSLVIMPYDISAIQAIEKAIQLSDLGLTPGNDGKTIRLVIPSLTAERRKEMTKTVSKLAEEGKVAIRNVRRDAMKVVDKLEKDGSVGEDERKDLEAAVQKLTDDYVKEVEKLAKGKQDELTKV